MGDYTPVETGGAIPFKSTTSADTLAGQLVMVTGDNTVGPASAASTAVVGVAAFDALSGKPVTVWPLKNVTHLITSTGSITAGALLTSGAAGVVAGGSAAYGDCVGRAIAGATGGALIRFLGY